MSFDTQIPATAYGVATEAQIQEWLEFALHAGSLNRQNPLYSLEVEACYGSLSWRPLPGQEPKR